MTTSSVKKIDSRLEKLEPGSLRHQVMTALRQFRASWVELGRLLNEVVYGGDYKEWGYDDFEVYCARELGLKKPTVQKLMVSYNYMRKYEGNRLDAYEEDARVSPPEIPDFQTVELLDRVRRRDEMPEETINELHRRAFNGDAEEPELRKELRQYLRPQPTLSDEEMNDRSASRKRELAGILRAARELRRRLIDSRAVPGGLKERLEQCLVELEGLEE